MEEKIRHLLEQHHAYYEVTPYYVVTDKSPGTRTAETRMIQHGFDVDVYGIKTSDDRGLPAISPDYRSAARFLQELAKKISSHSTDKCSIEITPFGSSEFLNPKDHFQASAKLQVRITHQRGLDQPAGLSEQRALEEIEKQLQSLGITRRN